MNEEASVTLSVRVVPRAKRNQIDGWHGDALKIRLNAPPVDGKANAALIAFLAETFGVKRSNIEILTGASARTKMIRVRGVTVDQLKRFQS